jgi:hypothetical protein
VRKVFHGLANAEKPVDFAIRITGPNGFIETLNLEQAVAGNTYFSRLTPGYYTIEEINHDVPGFTLSLVTVNDRPERLPYSFYIGEDAKITITVDNYYTPPSPPPGAQTGSDRPTARHAILLFAGIGFMGSAYLYILREKAYRGRRILKR